MKRNIYTLTGTKTLSTVANAMEHYLTDSQNMECQTLTANDGTLLVQGRGHHDGVKQWIGMDKAITVKLTALQGKAFQAEIGHGQWLKKSLVMSVSMVVLWPLFITSGIGIVKQSQLPGQIEQALQRYLADLPLTEKKGRKEEKQALTA